MHKVGEKWGCLTLLRQHSINGDSHWECKCDCGQILNKKKLFTNRKLKACTRKCPLYQTSRNVGELPAYIYRYYIRNAERLEVECNLSKEFLWDLFLKQDRKCAISQLSLNFQLKNVSLDRKDSSKGYTEDNVQWVEKEINLMKSNLNEKEFINWCCKIHLNGPLLGI